MFPNSRVGLMEDLDTKEARPAIYATFRLAIDAVRRYAIPCGTLALVGAGHARDAWYIGAGQLPSIEAKVR